MVIGPYVSRRESALKGPALMPFEANIYSEFVGGS